MVEKTENESTERDLAFANIQGAFREACEANRFMSVVWFVDDKGQLHCHRTTWQFPTDRMTEARQQLKELLANDETPPPEALPFAEFLQMGMQQEEAYDETC